MHQDAERDGGYCTQVSSTYGREDSGEIKRMQRRVKRGPVPSKGPAGFRPEQRRVVRRVRDAVDEARDGPRRAEDDVAGGPRDCQKDEDVSYGVGPVRAGSALRGEYERGSVPNLHRHLGQDGPPDHLDDRTREPNRAGLKSTHTLTSAASMTRIPPKPEGFVRQQGPALVQGRIQRVPHQVNKVGSLADVRGGQAVGCDAQRGEPHRLPVGERTRSVPPAGHPP